MWLVLMARDLEIFLCLLWIIISFSWAAWSWSILSISSWSSVQPKWKGQGSWIGVKQRVWKGCFFSRCRSQEDLLISHCQIQCWITHLTATWPCPWFASVKGGLHMGLGWPFLDSPLILAPPFLNDHCQSQRDHLSMEIHFTSVNIIPASLCDLRRPFPLHE